MSEGWTLAMRAWNWEPTVVIGTALFVITYFAAIGPLRSRFPGSESVKPLQAFWFLLGTSVMFFALVSPLDWAGDEYLLSAHMAQHILLMLVFPPLLLLGTPGWMLRPMLRRPTLFRIARFLTTPVVAFCLFTAGYIVWHTPVLYDAAMNNELIHVIEHLSFMATGVIAWFPILSPLPELPRLSYPGQILYLFLQMLPMTVVAALITFAPMPLYAPYVEAPRLFGISVMTDQEIAGLIMWMPGAMIYLLALGFVYRQWARQNQEPLDGQPI